MTARVIRRDLQFATQDVHTQSITHHVLPLTPNDLTTSGAARTRASMTSVDAWLRMAVRSGSIPYSFLVVTASAYHVSRKRTRIAIREPNERKQQRYRT